MALWSWAVGSVFLELKALRLLSNVEQGAFKSFLGKWASLLKAIACLELALIIILIVGIFLNTVMAFAYVIGFVLYLFAILFTFGLILLSEDANDRFMYYPKRFFYWQNQFIKALNFHQEDLVVLVLIVMWVFPLVLSVSIVSFANKISRKT
ncbi:MAG: hypothetical protein NZM38_11010 [Cytophagales bacterium]|nr:hypothetical protein [Cytophagales bacterium]MDW8385284.1 hypothetical protein [Flammeovirgaceae bacterium]